MTIRQWMRRHRAEPGLCADCRGEVGAFEVDGTRRRLGYGCLRAYLDAAGTLTLGELLRRMRGT